MGRSKGTLGYLCLSMVVVGLFPAASFALTPALEKIGDEISAVENEILKGDTKNATAQIQRLRKLMTLQRKEIKLTEVRVQELTVRMASFGGRKTELETAIIVGRASVYKGFKRLSLLTERRLQAEANPTLDALWLATADEEFGETHYVSRLTLKQSSALAKLKSEREQVLALETQMGQERDALDYYIQELKEKESLLVANEKFSRGLLAKKKQINQEGLARLSHLKDMRESERDLKKMIQSRGDQNSVASALYALKGHLPLPVKGEVVSHYGRSYDTKTSLLTFQKGVSISTFGDSEVKCIAQGRVVYSGALKNYGQMIIVEHPGQVYSLYGQLGQALVKEGTAVSLGAVLGRTRSEGTPLYFELRERNIAMNPAQWFEPSQASLTFNR